MLSANILKCLRQENVHGATFDQRGIPKFYPKQEIIDFEVQSQWIVNKILYNLT